MGEEKYNKKHKHYRKKKSSIFSYPIVVWMIVCVVLSLALYDYFQRRSSVDLMNASASRTQGAPEAKIQIIEFTDFSCKECARGKSILDKYQKFHPQKILWTVKHYPMGKMNSLMGAYYSECAADQNLFWPFYSLIMKRQSQWQSTKNPSSVLNLAAQDVGVDVKELKVCLDAPRVRAIVEDEKILGEVYKVTTSPTYFLNGEKYVGADELWAALNYIFE